MIYLGQTDVQTNLVLTVAHAVKVKHASSLFIKDFDFLAGNMVHPRTEPPASHWIPGGKAAERQKAAEINQQVAEHGTDTTTSAR